MHQWKFSYQKICQTRGFAQHAAFRSIYPVTFERLAEICNGPGECVIACADDITIIVRSASKIRRILACFERFGVAEVAKLNQIKTEAMKVGAPLPCWEGFVKKNVANVLGVFFKSTIKETVDRNWETVSVNGLLWMHRPRVVNIKQKVILLNTFICSKLWYMSSILPIPNKYVAQFTKQIGYFYGMEYQHKG